MISRAYLHCFRHNKHALITLACVRWCIVYSYGVRTRLSCRVSITRSYTHAACVYPGRGVTLHKYCINVSVLAANSPLVVLIRQRWLLVRMPTLPWSQKTNNDRKSRMTMTLVSGVFSWHIIRRRLPGLRCVGFLKQFTNLLHCFLFLSFWFLSHFMIFFFQLPRRLSLFFTVRVKNHEFIIFYLLCFYIFHKSGKKRTVKKV